MDHIKIYYFPIRVTKSIDLEKLNSVLQQTTNKDIVKFSNIINTIKFVNYFGQLYTHVIKYLVIKNNDQRDIIVLGIADIKNLSMYKRIIFSSI